MTAGQDGCLWDATATTVQRLRAAIARADRFRGDVPRSWRPVVVRVPDLEQLLDELDRYGEFPPRQR